MRIFTFNRGTWEDGHSLPEWAENESHVDYLARIGYSTVSASYGTEYGGEVEIFEAHEGNTFYALVTPTGNTSFEVFLPDFPSYMLFIKDYGTPFAAGGSNTTGKDIMEALGKFFRAQHGHDVSGICNRCDPEGWARWKESQQKRVGS